MKKTFSPTIPFFFILLLLCNGCIKKPNIIYVSIAGTDSSGCGLAQNNPCRSISYGINEAHNQNIENVFVQTGTYNEIIFVKDEINVKGGFDSDWEYGEYLDDDHKVMITGGISETDNQYMTITATGINTPTELSDLIIFGPDATGSLNGGTRSSYAIYIVNSSGLSFNRIYIKAGAGANGASGLDGTDASQIAALSGDSGDNSSNFTTICNTTYEPGGTGAGRGSRQGGNGGDGGSMDTDCGAISCVLDGDCTARSGINGTNAIQFQPNVYGYRGEGGETCYSGSDGNLGMIFHGNGGSGASFNGEIILNYWHTVNNAANGTLGNDGTGGGGGGGGGGCDTGTDSSGGGGGGGGEGGLKAPTAGAGGQSGGSSFGFFIVNSAVNITDVEIFRGAGGSGGKGGAGGIGQLGGTGGRAGEGTPGHNNQGGNGGNGGDGGNSGGGGGGTGGSVYGIYRNNSTLNTINLTYSGGTVGLGGIGGLSVGANGENGSDGSIFQNVNE